MLALPATAWMQSETTFSAPGTGTTITASGTAHTKGSYTELIASTAFDAWLIDIALFDVGVSGSDTGTLVDIAIGAAGSEQVIIPNLNAGHAQLIQGVSGTGQRYRFPLRIPSGSRIAARSQAMQTSDTVAIGCELYGSPREPTWAGSRVVDYGTDLANSQGTSVTANNAGEGSWTQITSATSQDHWYLAAGVAGLDGNTPNTSLWIDFGLGGSGSERAMAENFRVGSGISEVVTHDYIFAEIPVPSGTRIAARLQATASTDFDVIVYGVS